jgi:leader peptidase (prepilin peptidase)/N-methyltransferase
MIAIAASDARYFIIPDRLILAATALGFAHAALAPSEGAIAGLIDATARGGGLALAFWTLLTLYAWTRGRAGMGLGDVKLAAVAGVWLQWPAITIAVEIAALAALAVVAVKAQRGRRITGATPVPFGAFLAPAIWIGWLLQTSVLQLGW